MGSRRASSGDTRRSDPLASSAVMLHLRSDSVATTSAIAASLAGVARRGDLIVLAGEMGAGKTAFAKGFGRRELGREPMLMLLEASGVVIGRARQSISAKLADATVAQLLGVDVGSALLAVHRLVFDANERPVQWLQGLYRPDRYQYQMQLSRVGSIDAKVWVSKALTAQFH